MTIVAYGYGLAGAAVISNIFVNDILLSLTDEPEIILDPDIIITVDAEDVVVTLDADIDIEVD